MNGVRKMVDSVNIRPGVSVLSVLRHLNYKAWFALAEFVDNSVQSYLANQESFTRLYGQEFKLRVTISIDPTPPARLTIRDNAAGIKRVDFPRAFRAAAVPPDQTGLSEFGMGMKSAACWFAPRWSVRTKSADDDYEHLIRFDIGRIVEHQLEDLSVSSLIVDKAAHFTEITLEELYHVPAKKTVSKIKEHLADIYRVFIRQGWLELKVGNDILKPEQPPILFARYAKALDMPAREWRKEITFDLGSGQKVTGFAGLREPGNYGRSGFALFRRGRLIQGSGDEGYKPETIFGQPGSFRSLRLFGELHLEGFEVSHTKDGFRWDENEQPFLDLLKEYLDEGDTPLLRQADNYRALAARVDRERAAEAAVIRTAEVLKQNFPAKVGQIVDQDPVETRAEKLPTAEALARREIRFTFRGESWHVSIELSDDQADGEWLSLSDMDSKAVSLRSIEIRVSYVHPFMVRFASRGGDSLEGLLRLAAAIGLAEALARNNGVKMAGTVRRNVNEILYEALSSVEQDLSV